MEENLYMGIKETLLNFMREEAYRPMDIQELVSVFDINPDEYKETRCTGILIPEEECSVQKNCDSQWKNSGSGLRIGRKALLLPDWLFLGWYVHSQKKSSRHW